MKHNSPKNVFCVMIKNKVQFWISKNFEWSLMFIPESKEKLLPFSELIQGTKSHSSSSDKFNKSWHFSLEPFVWEKYLLGLKNVRFQYLSHHHISHLTAQAAQMRTKEEFNYNQTHTKIPKLKLSENCLKVKHWKMFITQQKYKPSWEMQF